MTALASISSPVTSSRRGGACFEELTQELGPFLLALIIVLFVVTYVPPTVLWIPHLMMGK